MINIVFCADKYVADCLMVAVCSVVKEATQPVRITVFQEGIPTRLQILIEEAFKQADRRGRSHLIFKSVSVEEFRKFPSLHGNYMTYARLLMPSLMEGERRAIYLDCDVRVVGDICKLWDTDLGGFPVAGVSHTRKKNSIEQDVWKHYDINLNDPYFSAGVVVIDLEQWREEDVSRKFNQYLENVKGMRSVVDQTALNVVFYGRWKEIGIEWNFPAWCGDDCPVSAEYELLHYVGAPKPWDIGGVFLNPTAADYFAFAHEYRYLFEEIQSEIGFFRRLRRSWNIRRTYYTAIKKRLLR